MEPGAGEEAGGDDPDPLGECRVVRREVLDQVRVVELLPPGEGRGGEGDADRAPLVPEQVEEARWRPPSSPAEMREGGAVIGTKRNPRPKPWITRES